MEGKLKMRKTLIAAAIVGATVIGASPSLAKPVQCFLQIGGKTYLDKICEGDFEKDGSFSIGANGGSRYFAYVNRDGIGGEMIGYWNGVGVSRHANSELGTLSKSGSCWANDRAKICAWKIGERRDLKN